MAYFLKKTKRNDRLYLSIYESFYSPETKNTRHKSFRKIGFVDALIEQGIDDPISHFQKEVNELNSKRETEKCRINFQQISDVSPELCLGYVPIAKILNILDVKEHFGYLSSSRKFEFDVYDVFSALVYARVVAPLSKHQTFHDILPKLYVQKNFSYDQLLEGLEFMGEEYEKLVEILTVATDDNFILDSSRSYFDCTNYYFEIDKESTLQKRGPSKENRRDPIVGMGLLLDAQMLPVGMKIFPGNESEKPVMRDLIHDLKSRNNIKGRTIQIADKGLNCAKNIIEAIDNVDGYLFSKSVKTLPEREGQWVLLDDGFETVFNQNGEPVYKIKECIDTFTYSYKDDYGNVITRNIKEKRTVTYNFSLAKKKLMEINRMIEKAKAHRACQAKKEEYGESSKYMQFLDDQGKSIKPQLNLKAIAKDKELAGYNMLVTSEINMSSKDIYNAYHQLWQIEESFRIMKSELDTRPVYLQKENRIKGHFFICYTAVLLSRILQFKILENKYSASTIYDFMRKFRVVRINSTRFINLLTSKEFVTDLSKKLNQPITNYYLTDKQIKMMHTR